MKVEPDFSTRKMILTMLKTSGPLSVSGMAHQLGITEMAVRRHINTMERDGLITATLTRQAMGRPSHMYSLTDYADNLFPKNYHSLVLDLLEELDSDQDADVVERLFQGRKEKLAKRYEEHMRASELKDRVEALAKIQTENGYMADWEPDTAKGGFIIDEFNCPISQVANRYQHACQSELELFRQLLGAEVERVECLAKDGRRCRYLITERAKE